MKDDHATRKGELDVPEQPPLAPPPKTPTKKTISQDNVIAIVFVVAIAAFIAGGMATTALQSDSDEKSPSQTELAADLSRSESTRENLEEEIRELERQLAQAQDAASDAHDRVFDRREDELEKLEEQIAARRAELAELRGAIRQGEMTSFGDGTWRVGTDIVAGLYRAPGGRLCYWAELNSANNTDIVTVGGGGPSQTVQIDTPWFETADCGEWKKIG